MATQTIHDDIERGRKRDRGVLALACILFGVGIIIWLIWMLVTTMEPAMQMLLLGLLIGVVLATAFASLNHMGLLRQLSQVRQDLQIANDRLERTSGLLAEANNVISYMRMAAHQIRGAPGYVPQQVQQYLGAPPQGAAYGYNTAQFNMPPAQPSYSQPQYGYGYGQQQQPDMDPFPPGQPNLPRGGQNGLNDFDVVERG